MSRPLAESASEVVHRLQLIDRAQLPSLSPLSSCIYMKCIERVALRKRRSSVSAQVCLKLICFSGRRRSYTQGIIERVKQQVYAPFVRKNETRTHVNKSVFIVLFGVQISDRRPGFEVKGTRTEYVQLAH
jgi:hypothetical protein